MANSTKKLTTEEFIKRARAKHGDRYDYSISIYKDAESKIKIICPDHGIFEQSARLHWVHGCGKCSKELPKKEFFEKARLKHGCKYNYSKVVYDKSRFKVKIICPVHGEFLQTPNNHLMGMGCELCGNSSTGRTLSKISKNNKQDFSHIIPPEGAKVVPLTKGQYSLVDEEDYDRVMEHNWFIGVGGKYATNNTSVGYLHRFIMCVKEKYKTIDHINGDGLDNRKINLRICTQQENNFNKGSLRNSSSKFKGVSWIKRDKKWRATIGKNYKSYILGLFENEQDAAKAYDKAAIEMHGKFAYLNFKNK